MQQPKQLYIGLMSGTSVDAIDAAIVDLSAQPKLIAAHSLTYSAPLKKDILSLAHSNEFNVNLLGQTDRAIGELFAETTNQMLKENNISKDSIIAIGSHGQTIHHNPKNRFTMQIGDPNIIATRTGITTVADFRRKDIANGGEGAPFAPAFHHAFFHSKTIDRIILNIGGIANITYLKHDDPNFVLGFDTGPGNTLMDQWILKNRNLSADIDGQWAASGTVNQPLLNQLLTEPYFQRTPPKSTAPELFNLNLLKQASLAPENIQATLLELTATSITNEIKKLTSKAEILVCGGGAHNVALMNRLSQLLSPNPILTTETIGYPTDWLEAIIFAWLAKQTVERKNVDLTKITGATVPAILGGIYYP